MVILLRNEATARWPPQDGQSTPMLPAWWMIGDGSPAASGRMPAPAAALALRDTACQTLVGLVHNCRLCGKSDDLAK